MLVIKDKDFSDIEISCTCNNSKIEIKGASGFPIVISNSLAKKLAISLVDIQKQPADYLGLFQAVTIEDDVSYVSVCTAFIDDVLLIQGRTELEFSKSMAKELLDFLEIF